MLNVTRICDQFFFHWTEFPVHPYNNYAIIFPFPSEDVTDVGAASANVIGKCKVYSIGSKNDGGDINTRAGATARGE
jgi:hypothetical protein